MFRGWAIALLCLAALAGGTPASGKASAQRVADRIVVRIEDDIITSSEMQELAAYQELVDEQAQPNDRLVAELIEQWVVNSEASTAHFPAAADSEIDREIGRIRGRFASQQAYEERLAALEISAADVRRMVARQIFLARYLDYKFRPAVQVEDAEVEKYYREQFAPALKAKNQQAPPIDEVREQIREVLVQQGISERATSWIDESKTRLNIEVEPAAGISAASVGHE